MITTERRRLLPAVLLLGLVAPALAQQPASIQLPGAQQQANTQQPPSTQQPTGRPAFTRPGPRPFIWWKSEPFTREIGLTADQTARINAIWETARPELRQEGDELSKLDDKLSRLIQANADDAVLARQIDRVEMARANANKTRALMLVQMRKVLTTEQRVRLDAIHERWLNDVKSDGPAGSQPSRRGDGPPSGREDSRKRK